MKKVKWLVTVVAICALAFCLVGCGNQEQKVDCADDEAMAVIADGIEARCDAIDKSDVSGSELKRTAIQTELDVCAPLKDRQFEDSKMQERVVQYINLLNDSMDVVESCPESDYSFYEKWSDVYDKRTALIKTFVEEYGLKLDAKHQSALDELVANGTAVAKKSETDEAVQKLIDGLEFEKKSNHGMFDYVAVAENTSGINLKDVSLTLALYDGDGVKAEEDYAYATTWEAGEKVKFSTSSSVDASEVKVIKSDYGVVD